MQLCTVFIAVFLFLTVFVDVSESSLFPRHHKVRPIRIVRESVPVRRTHLADGTPFEKYAEKGDDLPPLPIGEEADSLDDPRIGHLDKDGGIAVPVDENGKVLPGFEYLLKPITLTIDLDETDENGLPKYQIDNSYNMVIPIQEETDRNTKKLHEKRPPINKQKQENPVHPKADLLPEQESDGSEYDDVPAEPRESLPEVPELPKPDYSNSEESVDDVNGGDVGGDQEDEDEDLKKVGGDGDEDNQGVQAQDVIIPSTLIEKPINYDKKKEGGDVEIPRNNVGGDTDEDQEIADEVEERAEIAEKVAERIAEKILEEEESLGLSDEELQDLAKDLGKSVYDNVMNKANDFTDLDRQEKKKEEAMENGDDDDSSRPVGGPEEPRLPELPIIRSEDLDGVILPEQSMTEEEFEAIEEEVAEKEDATVAPRAPNVRGARIGAGVQPDSATQNSVIMQFFMVALTVLCI